MLSSKLSLLLNVCISLSDIYQLHWDYLLQIAMKTQDSKLTKITIYKKTLN